jgi:hypothetical protein
MRYYPAARRSTALRIAPLDVVAQHATSLHASTQRNDLIMKILSSRRSTPLRSALPHIASRRTATPHCASQRNVFIFLTRV